jgi:outer membrane immunogenic protein
MQKILVGAVLVSAFSTAAFAADLPSSTGGPVYAPPPPSWSGFYIGGNIGYGYKSSADFIRSYSPGLYPAVAKGTIPSALGDRPNGVLGGGQIGYNWQNGLLVIGVETDFQWSGIHRSNDIYNPGSIGFIPTQTTAKDDLDWFGTARLRIGWSVTPTVLLYGTGGFAYGEAQNRVLVLGSPPYDGAFEGASGGINVGWTAGVGFEWKATNQLSFKAEYLHVDLGNTDLYANNVSGSASGAFVNYRIHHDDDLVRLGLNYQLDWFAPSAPVVAKY